jgi:plastocyanin
MRIHGASVPAFLIAALVIALASCADAAPAPAEAPVEQPAGAALLITLVAHDIAFDPVALSAPPGVALHVELENRDPGIPHGLVLRAGPGFGMSLRESEIVAGPAGTSVEVPGLVPGRYQFSCPVHPNMTADLTVGSG